MGENVLRNLSETFLGKVRENPNEEWRVYYTIVYRRPAHREEGMNAYASDG